MSNVFREFREFLFRGNVVELAVALVIAGAFGAVVTSFVKDILTPLLGLLGVPDFSTAAVQVGSAQVRYGAFLNAVITLVAVAAAIFFVVIKPMERRAQMRAKDEPIAPLAPTELSVLEEIRDELRRRPAANA